MIWHIFRKDCRVLRFAIGGAALAHAIAAATWIAIGPFEQGSTLVTAAYLLSSLALISMTLLVVMAVHEDPLTGATRDWSVRPIKRRDMLLAKVVFAVLAAHGPLLIVDFLEALAFGFPIAQAANAALVRGFTLFCSLTLPALVIAAFTRTMTAWIVTALAWIIGTTVLLNMFYGSQRASIPLATMDVLAWMPNLAVAAIILCASAIALPLIYARKFASAAAVMLAAPALASATFLVPWPVLFEIQRSLSPREELAGNVHVSFDAQRFQIEHAGLLGNGYARVLIPLRLSGLADDRMLVIDNATVRLVDNGSTVFSRDDARCTGAFMPSGTGIVCNDRTPIPPARGTGAAWTVFPLDLPIDVYERLRDRPLQVEIDFALTLLDRTGNAAISGDKDRQWFDVGGKRCLARQGEDGWGAQLRCLHTTLLPACERTLVGASVGREVRTQCRSDYAPFAARRFPDVIDRGTPAAPIIGIMSSRQMKHDSSVTLETFAPLAYFQRSITIPAIRLSDQRRYERPSPI